MRIRILTASLLSAGLFVMPGLATPATAQTIIDEWPNVKAPPAPALTAVTVDPKTTALLLLDLIKQTCNSDRRPRCVASLPKEKKLLDQARANGLLVVYSVVSGISTAADILPDVTPQANEPVVKGELDKFEGSDLDKILKDKGIKTVIVAGVASDGAILYTGTTAFLHGYQTIIPVDGVSASSLYTEQSIVYHFTSAPVIGGKVILTRIDMIKF
jgi:nicotinamidase-related amidase